MQSIPLLQLALPQAPLLLFLSKPASNSLQFALWKGQVFYFYSLISVQEEVVEVRLEKENLVFVSIENSLLEMGA